MTKTLGEGHGQKEEEEEKKLSMLYYPF